jgi:hypothetical protein
MHVRTGGALVASLVFFVAGCGRPPPPRESGPEELPAPTVVATNNRQVTIHVKDFT